ncbi:MAG: nicotinamide-nucleotide amidohydrolase family protein [Candidatus Sumerlaeota bacterium]|nr:nicotinamide-nucleotide amidohydrolase family protein [Candidatus Sumerlaeota bacterium]
MLAEIISTGTEICQGRYADTNAQYLSQELTRYGVKVVWHTTTLDEAPLLRDVLRQAARRADLVIMTGGLGPTEDDLTRPILAELAGVELIQDAKVLEMIVERFRRRGRPMNPSNTNQSLVPRGATILYNEWGTAPGIAIELRGERRDAETRRGETRRRGDAETRGGERGEGDEKRAGARPCQSVPVRVSPCQSVSAAQPGEEPGTQNPELGTRNSVIIALPGPPREMKPMFNECVRPFLETRLALKPSCRILDIHTIHRAESELNERLRDLFGADPRVTLAWLASIGQVDIRLSCSVPDPAERESLIEDFRRKVIERIGGEGDVYGYDADTLESVLGRMLGQRGMTIALAESCTGGLATKRLTDISGSSAYVLESFITYTNEAKIKRLGVEPGLIAAHGAVSEPVAIAMAEGVRRVSGATLGGGITGVAGPTGGTPNKPIGMVCVALATPAGTQVNTTTYMGDRDLVRNQAASRLFDMARRWLLRV